MLVIPLLIALVPLSIVTRKYFAFVNSLRKISKITDGLTSNLGFVNIQSNNKNKKMFFFQIFFLCKLIKILDTHTQCSIKYDILYLQASKKYGLS